MRNKLYSLFLEDPEEFILLINKFRERFSYDPESGLLSRKVGVGGQLAGSIVGTDNGKGYLRTSFNNEQYLVHLIIYAMQTNEMAEVVDHKDLDKKNNRWSNLRPTNKSGNERNTSVRSNSTTGIKNVYWIPGRHKYRVQFKVHGETKYFGYYDTIQEAEVVAERERRRLHGEFARS